MEVVFVEIFKNYGAIVTVLLGLIYLLIKYFKPLRKYIKKYINNQTSIYRPKNMLQSKLTYWLNFKINTLHLDNKCKELIFKELLLIKFNIISDNIFRLDDDPLFDDMPRNLIHQNVITIIKDINDEFIDIANKHGIPEVVIGKYLELDKVQLNNFFNSVDIIIKTPIYKTNQDVINAVYLFYISMLELCVIQSDKILNDLNGSLTGTVFNDCVV